jgi:hypothetical protein
MRRRRRTLTGTGIAVVATTALALSGCSGGGDGDNEGKKQPTASATVSAQQPTATATTSAPAATGDLTRTVEGIWSAMEGGTPVQLVLGQGRAALNSPHLCTGEYTDQDGIGLTLTCVDGDKEHASGRGLLSADGKTLTVSWTGGPTDTLTRMGLTGS